MEMLAPVFRRLPPLLQRWVVNTRTLILHPTAIATIGVVFRRTLDTGAAAPWWNDRAIRYTLGQLRPGDRVFEWGSGASTIWLTEHGAKVTSVEHNPDWLAKVTARCPGVDIRSVGDGAQEYAAAIDEFEDGAFDIVIVDGIHRADCLSRGAAKVKPGGLLILDDTDRPQFARLRRSALPGWAKESFIGFKVTTDIRETTFFRRPR